MHEAMFYELGADGRIICGLCHHRCKISEGKRGICGVREHRNGRLYSLVYGRLVSENIDPIEKKPLFHVLPGSRSYSIATIGCNFQCLHCQNYQISQYPHLCAGEITGAGRTPQEVVTAAKNSSCASISYTYVEPTIFYEFAYDCARLARNAGLKNVFVSNGYMTGEVVHHLAPVLDGINIDLKAFTNGFYQKVCKAQLAPVMENIRLFHSLGVLVEVTTLLIPGLNDSEQEMRDIAAFLKGISADIPWHVSGFYPTYKMQDRPATPADTIARACAIGR
ncbi:MAG: AmmeMemoRadiSam system radical SAM enzyme, partial [Desulfobulbus sp.]|nr:AmmeMemoRadiSam system radical SAM enzyme [Desulfobulbus sp.]